ncbi:hypothetical protein DFH05DRAFT_1466930 [Lentinula detonsa]|uniref:Aldehyde dehydrogenase domain-containing protein n=1 Tax=Lentinula detonsa TaxID=2804962 RepID=A0A9W8U2Y4_9AGAR|nr:hypothetical protein DFH05DRAFT_1466930 [Lentinula detonsa]
MTCMRKVQCSARLLSYNYKFVSSRVPDGTLCSTADEKLCRSVESNRISTPRGFCLCRYAFQLVCYRRQLEPCATPALVGNVVVWKPSPAATLPNHIVHHIFTKADVPPGVVQFVPGPLPEAVAQAIDTNALPRETSPEALLSLRKYGKILLHDDAHKTQPTIYIISTMYYKC